MSPEDVTPIEFTCPHCGERMDAAANSQGRDVPPGPGHFWLCGECGEPGRFDNGAFGLLARRLHAHEVDELPPSLVQMAVLIQKSVGSGSLWDGQD